ncbi:tyrosine-type recombinase/integrase [Aureimonas sp. D3]|uniref:tyrosine-type recombinase/integrase n=1 Tax=Aureimonas sp. D3 TaxID=1638164 RepID=UPI000780DADB|nr:site-specific integrase [Aureimonas sp. D3]
MTEIDLPYIERNATRHGKMRYYFRFAGKRICRLPDELGSEEFMTEYWAARRQIVREAEPTDQPWSLSSPVIPRSFRWLCLRYMESAEFKALDITTQSKRRSIIESMWTEPVDPTNKASNRAFADMPIGHLDQGNVEVLRDRKKETPFAADERLKVLRQVFETKENGKPITANVAKLVKSFRQKSDGHHTITDAEIGQYIQHHGTRSKAALAITLLMYTGFRVSDLAQIGPKHRLKDTLRLKLFKNRNKTPTEIVVPIHPILEEVLSWHPAEVSTYMATEWGKPYSIKGLGNRISDWFTQAGLPHCTAHSVRKGLATNQAENEATDRMLEAMFGWRDAKTSRIYTARADRAKLARQAVHRINWDGIGERLLTHGAEDS